MAVLTLIAALREGEDIRYHIAGDRAIVHVCEDVSTQSTDPDQLEKIAETYLSAARDLRIALLDALEQRALRDEDADRADALMADELDWTKTA